MPVTAYTVDQSLVDAFLSRVDRFVNNVQNFGDTLSDMLRRPEPEIPETVAPETSMYQETAAVQSAEEVITADDINIDDLLRGLDLGDGVTL